MKTTKEPLVQIEIVKAEDEAKSYDPKEWTKYFHTNKIIKLDKNREYSVYLTKDIKLPSAATIVLLHSASHSALSWSLLVTNLLIRIPCQCVAIDLRGHGKTRTTDDYDFSLGTLATDVGDVLTNLFAPFSRQFYFVGHFIGAAVAVQVIKSGLVPIAIGLCCIDAFELDSNDILRRNQIAIRKRPAHFKNMQEAIRWASSDYYKGKFAKTAAKVAIPAQLLEKGKRLTWINDMSRLGANWTRWFEEFADKICSLPVPVAVIASHLWHLDLKLRTELTADNLVIYAAEEDTQIYLHQPEFIAEKISKFIYGSGIISRTVFPMNTVELPSFPSLSRRDAIRKFSRESMLRLAEGQEDFLTPLTKIMREKIGKH